MTTIYKYPIEITDTQELSLPQGAKILHAGLDAQRQPCIWAIVEPNNPPRPTPIYLTGTGGPLPPEPYRHLNTFIQGPFIWHVFLPALP